MVAFCKNGASLLCVDLSSSDMDSTQYIYSDLTSYVSDDVCHSEGLDALSSIHVHEELLSIVHGDVDIHVCEGFPREQWVGLDVVLLNHMVADGIL